MRFQLVIFDLGGVLVNVEPKRLVQEMVRQGQRSAEELGRLMLDQQFLESFELGRTSAQQFYDQANTRLGLSWSFEQFVTAWNSILSENTQNTWLLQHLRLRYRLLVLTNTDVLHDEHIRRTWPAFNQIHHWVASYQVGFRKPEPEIFRLALRQAEASPSTTLFIDDTKDHVETARQLGIKAIHFTKGLVLEDELRGVGVHV